MIPRGSVWVYDEEYHYSIVVDGDAITCHADAFQISDALCHLSGKGKTLREARSDLAHYIRRTVDHLKSERPNP